MPQKPDRRTVLNFPHEETWLREFVGIHGTDAVTQFCEDDLRGVSLTRIVEVLAGGTVVEAEKCDGPGTVCVVEHYLEEDVLVSVRVHFVSNEETLTILSAEEMKELEDGSDHAA